MADAQADVTVVDNPAEARFEAHVDGSLAGFAEYDLADGVITFVHTEVDDAFEGHGVGSTLVRSALDDVLDRSDLRGVRASCPFVRDWIRHHPDYLHRVEAIEEAND